MLMLFRPIVNNFLYVESASTPFTNVGLCSRMTYLGERFSLIEVYALLIKHRRLILVSAVDVRNYVCYFNVTVLHEP